MFMKEKNMSKKEKICDTDECVEPLVRVSSYSRLSVTFVLCIALQSNMTLSSTLFTNMENTEKCVN